MLKKIVALFGLLLVLLLTGSSQAFYLDELDDANEVMYEDHEFNNSPFPTWQQYATDVPPEPQQAPEQPQKKPSFLKRLFSKAKKNVSLPIELAPKIVEDKPRTPDYNPLPVLRLPQSVRFGTQIIQPGFYQASLSEAGGVAEIKLYQQRQLMVAIPCQVKSQGQSYPQPQAQQMPVQLEDLLMLNYAEDGQFATLQYKDSKNGRLFEGMPLPFVK